MSAAGLTWFLWVVCLLDETGAVGTFRWLFACSERAESGVSYKDQRYLGDGTADNQARVDLHIGRRQKESV